MGESPIDETNPAPIPKNVVMMITYQKLLMNASAGCRILHPALAFMSNFWYVIIITTFFGIGAGFVSSIGLSPMFWALGTATGNQGYISLRGYPNIPVCW